MSTAELTLAVEVEATAQATFEALVDWERQGQWMLGTTVEATRARGRGVGARISAFTGWKRAGFTDTMEITAWDPPWRCDVLHTGRVVRGTGSFTVEALGAQRSRFVWREDFELPLGGLGALGWPLARPVLTTAVRLSLKRFAAWVPTR